MGRNMSPGMALHCFLKRCSTPHQQQQLPFRWRQGVPLCSSSGSMSGGEYPPSAAAAGPTTCDFRAGRAKPAGNFLFAAGRCSADVKSRGVGWMWPEKLLCDHRVLPDLKSPAHTNYVDNVTAVRSDQGEVRDVTRGRRSPARSPIAST